MQIPSSDQAVPGSPTAPAASRRSFVPRLLAPALAFAPAPRLLASAPRLLAPAGDWECLRAAVANGADAVYFGLPRFNARLRADNFTEADLPEVMDFLHRHGVRGYVTCNVLIFSEELDAAQELLDLLAHCRVDAVIVQDVGLALLAQARHPGLRVHASTQMSITSPEGVALAASLGISQVVLARELSLRELRKFQTHPALTSTNTPPPALEVFVHGALCVAYSGQCLTSEALGQRSANRGECAQACRMPYELVVDGETRDLGDRRYLLSPQDLAAVEEIPGLLEAGVTSFKIEGRLKSAEYVAAVTAVYRRALDQAVLAREGENGAETLSADDWYALEMVFSRGLFSGWMHGVDHQKLVPARFGKKRGPLLGRIVRVERDGVTIDGDLPVRAGDGVVFDQGGDPDREQGGRVYEVGPGRTLRFARGKIALPSLRPGDRVWKTDDPHLAKLLRASWQSGRLPVRESAKEPVTFTLRGAIGQPLELLMTLGDRTIRVISGQPAQEAARHALTPQQAREALDHLRETPFRWGELHWEIEDALYVSPGELKRLRRAALSQWMQEAVQPEPGPSWPEVLARASQRNGLSAGIPIGEETEAVNWSVLCRTPDHVEAALAAGVSTLLLDFEDIRRYAPVVAELRSRTSAAIFLATPRIQKAGEEGFFKLIERAVPDGVLLRNPGALAHYADSPLRLLGDFSLNVANPLTAQFFLQRGVERVTVSYDLTAAQAFPLVRALPPGSCEITLHQHIPMFHMEHCVFAAFMSEGKDFTDCGRPCEKHQVHLRDRVGQLHPLRADVGCRNTLFRQAAQTGAAYYEEFLAAGVRHFRIELLEENATESAKVLEAYRTLFAGQTDGARLWQHLRAENRFGVTEGTLQARRAEAHGQTG